MTLPPPLRPSYWIDLNPPPFLPVVEKILLSLFVILCVAGIVGYILNWRLEWKKMVKRALAQVSSRLLILGIVGLFLYSFSYERIPVLSLRAGFLCWLALAGWYAWRTYRYVALDMPALEERQRLQQEKNKWLPKKA